MANKSTVKISKGHKRLMTPKEERAPLGKSKIWDDLSELRDNIIGGVHAIGTRILGAVRDIKSNPQKEECLPNKQYFYSLVQRASDDITNHSKIINEISTQHTNKVGDAQNADDYAFALHLHGKYTEITEITTNNLLVISQEMIEILKQAEETFQKLPKVTENSDGTNTIEFVQDPVEVTQDSNPQ